MSRPESDSKVNKAHLFSEKYDALSLPRRQAVYRRHVQGAVVRSAAIVAIWSFLFIAWMFRAIDTSSLIGITITGGAVILFNFPFLWGLKKIARRRLFTVYNLIINIVEAIGDTFIIYFLGGIRGMYLIIIYAALIAYVGVVAPRYYTFVVATVCSVSFASMALMEHFGIIPHQNNQWGYYYSLTEVVLIIISLTLTLYVLAFILSFTSNLLRKTSAALENRNKALERSQRELDRAAEQLKTKNIALEKTVEDLREAQAQLVEAEKMAALGGLVAGVAHEINTPVGIGVTASSFVQDKTQQMRELEEKQELTADILKNYLQTVAEASHTISTSLGRAVTLVKNFKQVAADQSSETRRRFNLKDYIDTTLHSLGYLLRRTRHTIRNVCPEDLVMDSYPGAFSQIISNLLINSLQHGFEEITEGVIHIEASVDGNHLNLRYADNGRGMENEALRRIFEPFFTTRRGDGGTGLGMHIVYNVVTQTLKGSIHCESSPGAGVIFDIRVPHTSKITVASHPAPSGSGSTDTSE
jgi:signal transduction histidine kinase